MKPRQAYVGVAELPDQHALVRRIRIGELELPIPNWSIPAFGVIVTLYVAFTLLSNPIQTVYSRYLLGKAEEQDQQEAYKHFAESAVMQLRDNGAGGTLDARLFGDGCVSVSWRGPSQKPPHPHFIRRITADEGGPPAPDPPQSGASRALDGVQTASVAAWPFDLLANALTPRSAAAESPAQQNQSHCLNPHPGSFNTSYGTRNGCWVQVWRNFQDGCTHYQWFNSCGNYWDVNQDGSPKVVWKECRH
jgi:hypothetical protein